MNMMVIWWWWWSYDGHMMVIWVRGECHPSHSFYRRLYPSIIKDIDVSLMDVHMMVIWHYLWLHHDGHSMVTWWSYDIVYPSIFKDPDVWVSWWCYDIDGALKSDGHIRVTWWSYDHLCFAGYWGQLAGWKTQPAANQLQKREQQRLEIRNGQEYSSIF